jgi:putative membrane-bound dehydrogenase-like protein
MYKAVVKSAVGCLHALLTSAALGLAAANDLPPGVANTQNAADTPPTPEEARKLITIPEGFKVTLFAGEPDVAQPIAINYDDRGRLWVAESFSYIEWKHKAQDRISIFEDTDNDGHFDSKKVFWGKANHLSGFQIGFGGVWVCDAPHLLFIPDKNRDDISDGPPVVMLDGWATDAEHNFLNGLTWGLDGWLWGRHGIKKPSLVGRPGTPDKDRVELSCAIWRFHPTRHVFEIVADGTVNPWGLDWNEDGQPFITTSVVDHLWHVVPGARFQRREGKDEHPNPYTYELMKPISDHRHWDDGPDATARHAHAHPEQGGGHAHSGLMIYQGDVWPEKYRNKAFFSNIHGNRINMDSIERKHSSYVAKHGPDFLLGNSPWFRAVDLKQTPDGNMMIAEWTDLGECHDRDGVHRTSGRLFKVSYGESKPMEKFDLQAMSDGELAKLLNHDNVWWRRQALLKTYERIHHKKRFDELMKRASNSNAEFRPIDRDSPLAIPTYESFFSDQETMRQVSIGFNEQHISTSDWSQFKSLRDHPSEIQDFLARDAEVAVRVETSAQARNESYARWVANLVNDGHQPRHRLLAASVMSKMPPKNRWLVAQALVKAPVPAEDRNLALMIWYGIEPLVAEDPKRALKLAAKSKIPLIRQFIARRVVDLNKAK